MPLRISCPSCGRSGRVPEQAIGRNVQCPACGHRYQLTAETTIPEGLELIDDDPTPALPPPPPQKQADPRFAPLKKKAPRPGLAGLEPPPAKDDPYAWQSPSARTQTQTEPGEGRAGVSPYVLGAGGVVALTLTALVVGVLVSRPRPGAATTASAPVRAVAPAPAAAVAGVIPAPAPAGRSLSTADVVAESDPSIALIRGKSSSGTGFLVSPGLLATNAHVIDGEFVSNLEIRFPAAEGPRAGPARAELLYEDARRDLAFLAVKTDLPALRVADAYTFRKGEEITVIGSPGLGDGVVLENAISRGVMSTRATLDGQPFYQLGIAVNPGNSGGPVFDSSGRVIGVVTLKTEKQESLAFCVPVEDLRAALAKLQGQPADETGRVRSRHRVVHAVKGLGTGGALYCVGIDLRRAASGGGPTDPGQKEAAETFPAALAEIDKAFLSTLMPEVPAIRGDALVAGAVRSQVAEIAENFARLKTAYDGRGAVPFGDLRQMKWTHRRLIVDLSRALGLEVPEKMLVVFNDNAPSEPSGGYAMDGLSPPGFGSFRHRLPMRPMIPRPPGAFGGPRGAFPTRPRIGPQR